MPFPDFLDVQIKSFRDFLQLDTPPEQRKNDGLYKVFAENFPITDTRNNFVLEFLDYYIDPPRYTIDECLERGLTYSVPLKAKMKLYCTDPDHTDFEEIIQDVFLGTIPYMTDNGTFIINGAERVVVSQLHRSPGVFFGQGVHANGTVLYSARIIPFKGSWIEFATDINNVMYAYIDRKKKLPVTTLLRAIGFETDKDILQIFDLAEEVKVNKKSLKEAIGRKPAAESVQLPCLQSADRPVQGAPSQDRKIRLPRRIRRTAGTKPTSTPKADSLRARSVPLRAARRGQAPLRRRGFQEKHAPRDTLRRSRLCR